MAVHRYVQGWDHRFAGTATVAWTDDSGSWSASVATAQGPQAHSALTSVQSADTRAATINLGFSQFRATLQTQMTASGSTKNPTVTFDANLLKYTLSVSGATFNITFSGAAGTLMRRILGLSGNKSGANSYVSDMQCWYTAIPAIDARSNYKLITMRADQIRTRRSDAGIPYSNAPVNLVRRGSWEHRFESPSHVHRRRADADTLVGGYSYSWEHFMEHAARYSVPCVIGDATEYQVFYIPNGFADETVQRYRADADPQQTVKILADPVIGYL